MLCMPAQKFGTLGGFETAVVSYATDIPAFGGVMGPAVLVGAGNHPRRAYRGRACAERRIDGSDCKFIKT